MHYVVDQFNSCQLCGMIRAKSILLIKDGYDQDNYKCITVIFKKSSLCIFSNLQVHCDCVSKYCLYISLFPSAHIFDAKSDAIFAKKSLNVFAIIFGSVIKVLLCSIKIGRLFFFLYLMFH